MYQKILLPSYFKKIGWWILIPTTLVGIILFITGVENAPSWMNLHVFAFFNEELLGETRLFTVIQTNITATVVSIFFIIGGYFVGFSKEKNEDEYIAQTRLYALLWAVKVNYILLIISLLFIYGLSFLYVMLYNMFTVLVLFIFRFNFMLFINAKSITGEK
ncbi:MAG: hypothetical protein JSS67_11805 [Bacteroidetes bacterium]|nr:hypothetical protein [Bacteroidota bacterium]